MNLLITGGNESAVCTVYNLLLYSGGTVLRPSSVILPLLEDGYARASSECVDDAHG